MCHARLLPLLAATLLLSVAPATALGHGGTDHGERVVDGQLVEVEASAPAQRTATGRSGTERWRATGPRQLAIVQIVMPGRDVTRYPEFSESVLRSAFVTGSSSASRALSEMTDGTVSLTGRVRSDGDVLPTVTASSSGDCRWQQWASDARAQLLTRGHDLTPYLASGNVAYVLRGPTGCSWSGLAWMPGTETWLANSLQRSLIVHELGHNFSLDHASSARCRDASGAIVVIAAPARCTVSEYGDPFDPMGDGDGHYAAPFRLTGGWLPTGTVRTVAQSGSFTLQPAADPLSATRMLRVPRPGRPDLTIELRKPYGLFDLFSASDPAVQGVLLRLHAPDSDDRRTQLLDAVTSTSTFADAALAVGRSVVDGETGIAVRLASLDGSGARVQVALDGDLDALDAPAPSAPPAGEVPAADAPAAPDPVVAQPTPTPPLAPTPPADTVDPQLEPPATTSVVPRRWRGPSSVVIDGRRRSAAALASRGGGVVRGRSIAVRFPRAVRELRVATRGCRARVAVRTVGGWRSLPALRAARASVRTSTAVRDVRVRCAGRARVVLDQLAGR